MFVGFVRKHDRCAGCGGYVVRSSVCAITKDKAFANGVGKSLARFHWCIGKLLEKSIS